MTNALNEELYKQYIDMEAANYASPLANEAPKNGYQARRQAFKAKQFEQKARYDQKALEVEKRLEAFKLRPKAAILPESAGNSTFDRLANLSKLGPDFEMAKIAGIPETGRRWLLPTDPNNQLRIHNIGGGKYPDMRLTQGQLEKLFEQVAAKQAAAKKVLPNALRLLR